MSIKVTSLPRPSGYKIGTVSYQNPYENVLGTPVSLPASEPGTPQVSWTVASGDLPVISGFSAVTTGFMITCGQNTDSVTRSIYCRTKKNGSQTAYGSTAISAGYYWTLHSFWYDIQIGDVLDSYLWGDYLNLEYDAHICYSTRHNFVGVISGKDKLMPTKYTATNTVPTLVASGLNPGCAGTYGSRIYPTSSVNTFLYIVTAGTIAFTGVLKHDTYKLFRVSQGDASNLDGLSFTSHATDHPRYYRSYLVTQIEVRNYGSLE